MRRYALFLLTIVLTTIAWAQTDIVAHILDAETGEALPYVSIYAQKATTGTITNSDGDFHLKVEDDDTLTISFVGYETLRIPASNVNRRIEMWQVSTVLHEVAVTGTEGLLQKIASSMERESKRQKGERRQYFMRQTNLIDGKRQMVEAYIKARPAISINAPSFLAGRHYIEGQAKDDDGTGLLWFSNLHHLLSLSPLVKNDAWNSVLVTPFNPLPGSLKGHGYKKRYDTETDRIKDADGRESIKVTFKAKVGTTKDIILCGNLYVDANTLCPIAFDGHLENFSMKVWTGLFAKQKPAQLNLHISYGSGKNAYQIESLAYTLQCTNIRCNTILYALDKELQWPDAGINGHENMLVAIERSSGREELWHDDIVKKTWAEERLANGQDGDIASTVEGPMKKWLEGIQKSSKEMPQEKVYLHLDNNSYFLGDTIWFKAYTRQTDTDAPSTLSNVLYVELLNHDGYPMQRKIVRLENGEGHGELALKKDSTMYSGFYEIRAYTRWQLNWGAKPHKHPTSYNNWFYNKDMANEYFTDYDKIYSRVVPVYDQPLYPGDSIREMTLRRAMRYYGKTDKEEKPQVDFFPEGGSLVVGVPCHVAFEARTEEGEYLEGKLLIENQEVPTEHRGRGTFTITPRDTKPMSATFCYADGKTKSVKLPKASALGVSVHVTQDADSCRVTSLPAGKDIPDTLGISIMHEGKLIAYKAINNQPQTIAFPLPALSNGVNQITIFDASGRVWADRLVFRTTDSTPTPTIRIDAERTGHTPNSAIHLTLNSIAPHNTPTYCSVAIRDKATEGTTHDNGTIYTEMLLASEIKGFVPNPGWYFEKNDDEHTHALDLLMMTQGWRRFDWKEIVTPRTDLHPAEKEIQLHGQVLGYYVYHKEDKDEQDMMLKILEDMAEMPHQEVELETNSIEDQTPKAPLSITSDEHQFLEEIIGTDYNIETHPNKSYRGLGQKRAPASTKVHAEFVQGRQTIVREANVQDGHFTISMPHLQDLSIMHIAASDTSKWSSHRQHQWICPNEDEYPEYYVKLQSPFIHDAKPYNYYHTHLPSPSFNPEADATVSTSGVHTMKQLSVFAKNGRLISKAHVPPAIRLDAIDAFNLGTDAGLIDGWMTGKTAYSNAVAHYFIGDKGLYDNGTVITLPRQAAWDAEQSSTTGTGTFMSEIIPEHGFYEDIERLNHLHAIDSVYIYTDYAPRRFGDSQYMGENLPKVYVFLKGYEDNTNRVTYRDRMIHALGYSSAAEFYHPDYSKHKLPEGQKDYRRTLYWNPNLQLDENGEAHITFYNNSTATTISVEAEGQTSDGTLLWSK